MKKYQVPPRVPTTYPPPHLPRCKNITWRTNTMVKIIYLGISLSGLPYMSRPFRTCLSQFPPSSLRLVLSLSSFYLPYVSLPPLTSLSTLVLGACTHLRVPTHTYYRALQQLALFHPPPTLTPSTPAPPHSSDASKRSSQIPVAGVGQACSPPYSPRFIFSSLL